MHNVVQTIIQMCANRGIPMELAQRKDGDYSLHIGKKASQDFIRQVSQMLADTGANIVPYEADGWAVGYIIPIEVIFPKNTKNNSSMRKILIAMSHRLTGDQASTLSAEGYEYIYSEQYQVERMNQLEPMLSAEEIMALAEMLIREAQAKQCEAIAMVGEPTLTFYVWLLALHSGLRILVSTTRRDTREEVQEDGSVRKIQIFRHVQWREIVLPEDMKNILS